MKVHIILLNQIKPHSNVQNDFNDVIFIMVACTSSSENVKPLYFVHVLSPVFGSNLLQVTKLPITSYIFSNL